MSLHRPWRIDSRSLRLSLSILGALGLLCVLAAGGCGKGKPKPSGSKFPVGLVFDVGGIGDKSFNDSAYKGLLRARDELGIQFEYFEPGEGTDREAALRLLANGPSKLIFGVGFLFTDDIKKVATEFPGKQFACVDYSWKEGEPVLPNVVGIKFREEEGSYLVGALAGLVTQKGTVGFVGGMDIPLIHKFEAGYRAGFLATRPDGRVLVNYAGVTGDAFKNPAKGKELALSQFDGGADIIFHASGSTGLGVFEAARSRDALAIGVDADQWDSAPDHVLTSMVKKVDVAVFDVIRRTKDGAFPAGIIAEGLKEGGVDYVFDQRNQCWITQPVRDKVESLRQQIISGAITVPSR
jgi:basic membrane protein A and related proteins